MAPPAAAFGRLVAAYSRAVATSALVEIIPETPLPQSPTLWISWHENNLITLALHRRVTNSLLRGRDLGHQWLVLRLDAHHEKLHRRITQIHAAMHDVGST